MTNDVLRDQVRSELDRLARVERGRLMAHLVARLGQEQLQMAEDVTQEAILKALDVWSFQGLPENAEAWLSTVAYNKAMDALRRAGRERLVDTPHELDPDSATDPVIHDDLADDELRLLVMCCHPNLPPVEQLTLALKLSSGFTAKHLAPIFLVEEAAIGQRIARAKKRLGKLDPDELHDVTIFDLKERRQAVLKTVYLMFTLGYLPRRGQQLLLKDVCGEAIRLAELLVAHPGSKGPDADALLALMYFQDSRSAARTDAAGQLVPMSEQDRSKWDSEKITKGFLLLKSARSAERPSRYHLEASIAATHATASGWSRTDWWAIRTLYMALERLAPSPGVSINTCVAIAMTGQNTEALVRLDRLHRDPSLSSYVPLQLARAYVFSRLGRPGDASLAFEGARKGPVSGPVETYIERMTSECLV